MKIKIILLIALFILLISTNFPQQKISAKDAAKYIDSTTTVVDTVSIPFGVTAGFINSIVRQRPLMFANEQ